MPVIALSAIGSAILPKSVTRPRLRAMSPSILSVIIATTKITNAANRQPIESPPSISSAAPKNGTSTIRSVVRTLGRLRLLGLSAGARDVAHRGGPGTRDQVDAVALRPPTRGPGHRPRRRVPRSTVVPSTSGPWWAARPTTSPSTVLLDQHHDVLADPLLGALRGELLDQVGHVRGAGPDLVLVELVVVRRGLGAVLVGVAEHADHVEPGRDQEVAERLEVLLGLAGEADDHVGADAGLGRQRPDLVEQAEEALRVAEPAHPAQHRVAGVLEGEVEVRRDAGRRRDRLEQPRPRSRRAGGRRPGPARCRRRRPARAAGSRAAAGRRGPCRRTWSSR